MGKGGEEEGKGKRGSKRLKRKEKGKWEREEEGEGKRGREGLKGRGGKETG